MRIAILSDAQSIYTVKWCEQLNKLGHEVHVISFLDANIEGATVHHIDAGAISTGGGNWRPLVSFGKVKKVLKKIRPDILHAHYISSYGVVAALTGFHPLVLSALGTDVLVSPQSSFIHRIAAKHAFSKADWITAVAAHMIQPMLALGAPADRTEAVLFGIDPDIFNAKSYAPPAGRFVITSTRNFEPVYNIPVILKAVAALRDKISGLELRMIGAGSLREELKRMTEELGIKDITTFTGKLPQPALADELRASHLFISMSRSDGNPISVNEAMACGPFIIASNIPANAQWIKEGDNGLLADADDAGALSEKILYVYNNYSAISEKAAAINQKIVSDQLVLSTNMKRVERKYESLLRK
jgi:glycosyltransferase involved in cell wall biosynthesis